MLLTVSLIVSFFSGSAIARISAPDCVVTWEWSLNSLGQNACTVAAFLMSTCNAGSFIVDPLRPGHSYTGPSSINDSDLCKCSTVGYSLISACAGCQGEDWISWSEYVTNCTETLPPSSFPSPIPAGTRLPQWALLDVTMENYWNVNESCVVGDYPEVGPGRILGSSGTSVSVSASGYTNLSTFGGPSSNAATPTPIGRHGSNVRAIAAIAGGVIGGIAVISILVAVLFFYRQRRRSLAQSPVFEGDIAFDSHVDQVSRSTSTQGTVSSCSPETPISPMRPYCLDYPITYPEYQVTSPPPSYIRSQYAVSRRAEFPSTGISRTVRFHPLNLSQ